MAQLLDSLKQKIKKTLDDVSGAVSDNQGWIRQGKFTPVTNISEKATGKPISLGQATRQVVSQGFNKAFNPYSRMAEDKSNNAFIRTGSDVVNQGLKNYIAGSTFNLFQPKMGEAQTGAGKVVGAGTNLLGAINSPASKIVFGLPEKLASGATRKILLSKAPQLAGSTVAKILPGVTSEAAQTLTYAGLSKIGNKLGLNDQTDQFSPKGLTNSFVAGLGFRSAPNLVQNLLKMKTNGSMHPEDVTWMDTAMDTLRNKKSSPKAVQNAKTVLFRLGERYLKADQLPESGSPYLIGRRLQKIAGDAKGAGQQPVLGIVDKGGDKNINPSASGEVSKAGKQTIKLKTSNPKGNYTGQVMESGLSGSGQSPGQPKGGISIRTKANSEVSSTPSIEKGQLNINRLNVKGAGKKVLLQQESQVQPTVVGNKEIIDAARTAKGTGTLTDEQMKKMIANQLKNRQVVVDLTKEYNKAKKNGASEIDLGRIMLRIAEQSRTARQGGTFAGRLLQAQNIVADQSATPMQKIFALLDNAGVTEEKYLKDAVKVDWDNPAQVVNFYRKYVPPKLGEVLDEIRYSNMLSSPLTHITNIVGNAIQTAVVTPVEKTITGTLDFGKSLLTGSERKYYTSAGIDYAGGYVKALPQAFKKAWGILWGKDVSIRPDFEQIPTGSTGVLQIYTTPLRALEAMDKFFGTLVEGGVTNELKKGPQKLKLTQIADTAKKEADYRLFRQAFDPNGELGQGYVLQLFDKWNSAIGNLRRLPGGKWVLPFLQTPTNILKQGVEYSPLGVTTMIGAKKPMEQLSKTIIGTTVFAGAYSLAKGGLVSWEAPSGEKERELYYAAGMQPYSVKIGNKWVSFSKLGPLSYPFAMAAALADAEKKNPDQTYISNVGRSVSGMLGFFGNQSYVRSIGDLVDAIQGGVSVGPNALNAEAANLAGQLVPYKSFMTWLGRIIDPTYRKASSFGERMIKDLPVAGSNLEPYTDMNGNPSVRDYPVLNAVSPFKVTQEKSGSAQLLKQYQDKKIEKGIQKRADEAFAKGDQTKQKTGNLYRYIDDNGAVKTIDLSFPVGEYKPTGNKALDKELLSDYKSSITKAKNEVMKALEVGAITQEEAVSQLEKLQNISNSYSKGKKVSPGKPVKLQSTQAKATPKIQVSQVSIKTPKLNIPDLPSKAMTKSKVKIKTLPKVNLKISKSYGKNS